MNEPTTPLLIRCEPDLAAALRRWADHEHRSLDDVAGEAFALYLASIAK